MCEVRFYEFDEIRDRLLRFAVIVSVYKRKWVFCRHRERDTLEIPGGHVEERETVYDAAVRELKEETGADVFDIKPVCVYSVISEENFEGRETLGGLFFADIISFEGRLEHEIERVYFLEDMPEKWTYPLIQPKLIEEAVKRGFGAE